MFSAASKKWPADLKIKMLRLFEDCIDLSEPNSNGWIIVGDLVSSFNQENVPVSSNSISWFLRSLKTESMVAFGPKTIWHGLQHAVRSFIDLEQKNMVVKRRLGLLVDGEFPVLYGMAIAHLIVLRATGKHLLPMLVAAGGILHIEGYDFDPDTEIDPAVQAKMLPFLYSEWSKALTSSLETADEVMSLELDVALEEAGWSRDVLRGVTENVGEPGERKDTDDGMCCSVCFGDYSSLGMGLVEPLWVAFTECSSSNHRFNCNCQDFLQRQRRSGGGEHVYKSRSDDVQYDSDDENDIFHDAESDHTTNGLETDFGEDSWITECKEYIHSVDNREKKDAFRAIAGLLYRAQARVWLGSYEPGELLCGTCFLRREGYVDGEKDILSSMPALFSI
jgi:hypothetical protein